MNFKYIHYYVKDLNYISVSLVARIFRRGVTCMGVRCMYMYACISMQDLGGLGKCCFSSALCFLVYSNS